METIINLVSKLCHIGNDLEKKNSFSTSKILTI